MVSSVCCRQSTRRSASSSGSYNAGAIAGAGRLLVPEVGCSSDTAATILLANVAGTGWGFAEVVDTKGSISSEAHRNFSEWLEEAGLTNADMRIRTDQEPSAESAAKKLAQHRRVIAPDAQVIEEAGPVNSSGTMGPVERFSRSLQGIAQTLAIAMQER